MGTIIGEGVMDTTQQCRTCQRLLPLAAFWKQAIRKLGYQSECKDCMRARNNGWQRKNHETRHPQKLASIYRRRRLDPVKAWFRGLRWNAKARGIEFSLTLEDIVIPETCPILGIRMTSQIGNGLKRDIKKWDAAFSLDRIDNSRGYTPDNVVVVSYRANRIKSDATPLELRAIADFYNAPENIRGSVKVGHPNIAATDGRKPDSVSEVLAHETQEGGSLSCTQN